MVDGSLFAVVNDNPAVGLGPFTICSEADHPTGDAIYRDKTRAFCERDRLRDEFDNPDINVYKVNPTPVDDPRGDR